MLDLEMSKAPRKLNGPLLWLASRTRLFWAVCLTAGPLMIIGAVWFWPWGLSTVNAQRIVPGMTRAQVEGILGPPNPGQFDLARKQQAFWDAEPMLGFQYIALTVQFDSDGRVVSVDETQDFWRQARWLSRWW